jgi:methionine-S-sulfoxide reductase
MITRRPTFYFLSLLAIGAASLLMLGLLSNVLRAFPSTISTTDAAKPAQLPTTILTAPRGKEIATLAAGCFWSMEAIYENLKGVESVEPGYAGGHVAKPKYEQVGDGNTGHAEAVHIVFDPNVISYRDLLQVLLIMRDPTTINRQGPDQGTNYRSVIFAHNASQKEIATQAIHRSRRLKYGRHPS